MGALLNTTITFLTLLTVILICVLVPLTFGYCDYTEYCLTYGIYTKEVDTTTVYAPGRYNIGVGSKFLRFPKTYQNVKFSNMPGSDGDALNCRSIDGLSIVLDLSFQYSIDKANVPNVFNMFGVDYNQTLLAIARDSIRDTASRYASVQFFTNRTLIGTEMADDLRTSLNRVYITLQFLQLRSVDLPDTLDAVIEQKEVARQNVAKAQNDQQTAIVQAATAVSVAQQLSQIVTINATVSAQATVINAAADANATLVRLNALADGYSTMTQTLGLNKTELLSLAWIDSIREHDSASLLVNMDQPSIISVN